MSEGRIELNVWFNRSIERHWSELPEVDKVDKLVKKWWPDARSWWMGPIGEWEPERKWRKYDFPSYETEQLLALMLGLNHTRHIEFRVSEVNEDGEVEVDEVDDDER